MWCRVRTDAKVFRRSHQARKMSEADALFVNYGCGLSAPPTWINYDASPTLRLQRLPMFAPLFKRKLLPLFPPNVRFGDIVKGLPLAPSSCSAIYCSHVLEHLALDDFRKALKNTLWYLKDGGTFRLVVPDLEILAIRYVRSSEENAAPTFMTETHLGRKSRPRSIGARLRDAFGNSSHLWMWDFKSLRAELKATGFQTIRRAQFGDSREPRFKDVEELGRWDGCLGIECNR